jgi:hypothetical protein
MRREVADLASCLVSHRKAKTPEAVNSTLTQYYRCPGAYERINERGALPAANGNFGFGRASICYGSYHRQKLSFGSADALHDALSKTLIENGVGYLPFDPAQVVFNLDHDAYVEQRRSGPMSAQSNVSY